MREGREVRHLGKTWRGGRDGEHTKRNYEGGWGKEINTGREFYLFVISLNPLDAGC